MVKSLQLLFNAFGQLIFPHTCSACSSDMLHTDAGVCSSCLHQLPLTGYHQQSGNAVEEIFWGRITLQHAAACCFFTKKSRVQSIMHQVKYKHRRDAAVQIGEFMGHQLLSASWLPEIDLLLPMPLHKKRLQQRGYNQAALLCEGMQSILKIPLLTTAISRRNETISQTSQQRSDRWENMQKVFEVSEPEKLSGKHVLLVDDVVTTGATLEAMGEQLLRVPELKLSIYCFAYTLPH